MNAKSCKIVVALCAAMAMIALPAFAEDRGPAAPEFIWHDIEGITWCYHAYREYQGWSVQHEPLSRGFPGKFRKSESNPRMSALLDGFQQGKGEGKMEFDLLQTRGHASPRLGKRDVFPDGQGGDSRSPIGENPE